jgi:hypothetical protein
MNKPTLALALVVGLLIVAGPTLAHDDHHHNPNDVWWYTSPTGPYQDECASPYAYYNYGYQPYPYTNWPGATGPYLYHQQGHLHREALVVKQEVREVQQVQEKPAEPPPAEEQPKAKPEGD